MSKRFMFAVLFFVFPMFVSAACMNQDLIRYKNISGHLSSYYDYDDVSNVFNVTVQNLHSDLYIVNQSNGARYSNSSPGIGDISIPGLVPGSRITLKVYVASGECIDRNVYTMYLNIPYFNQYYSDSVCANNSNSLCSKWANTSNLTYEQFVEKVRIVPEEVEKVETKKENNREYGFLDFLGDYYIFFLLAIIVFGSFAIYYLDKKNRFDF